MADAADRPRNQGYQLIHRLLGPIVRGYSRLELHGTDNLPAGGAILALNHSGSMWWDVLCLASGIRERQVQFIAHHWDGRVPLMRNIVRSLGNHFMDEDIEDINAGSAIVQSLSRGSLMAIFPEESYHTFWNRYDLFEFTPHVIRYAQLARVPIIPVAVIGVEEAAPTFFGVKRAGVPLHYPLHPPLILPFKVQIEFGEPIDGDALVNGGRIPVAAAALRERVGELIRKYRSCRTQDVHYLDVAGLGGVEAPSRPWDPDITDLLRSPKP